MAAENDRALALAALDDGFKDNVKTVYTNFLKTWVSGSRDDAKSELANGVKEAADALQAARQIVTAAFTPPPTTATSNTVDHVEGKPS